MPEQTKAERMHQLELLIDATSLYDVLHLVAIVCAEKSEHLIANWNNRAAAKSWTSASYQIEKLADKIRL